MPRRRKMRMMNKLMWNCVSVLLEHLNGTQHTRDDPSLQEQRIYIFLLLTLSRVRDVTRSRETLRKTAGWKSRQWGDETDEGSTGDDFARIKCDYMGTSTSFSTMITLSTFNQWPQIFGKLTSPFHETFSVFFSPSSKRVIQQIFTSGFLDCTQKWDQRAISCKTFQNFPQATI